MVGCSMVGVALICYAFSIYEELASFENSTKVFEFDFLHEKCSNRMRRIMDSFINLDTIHTPHCCFKCDGVFASRVDYYHPRNCSCHAEKIYRQESTATAARSLATFLILGGFATGSLSTVIVVIYGIASLIRRRRRGLIRYEPILDEPPPPLEASRNESV